MSHTSIEKSLEAIQFCNPKDRLYLQVTGQGTEQHLEIVKKNWFGRLLMWLGFTSTCMKKVAKYVAENISALCIQSPDNRISLKELAGKITKYSVRHKGLVNLMASSVNSVLKNYVLLSVPKLQKPTLASIAAPATSSPLAVLLPPTTITFAPVASPTVAKVIITPAVPDTESVIEYKACRTNPGAVYALLRKYGKDETQFKELIQEMTPLEIYTNSPAKQPINPMDYFDLLAEDPNREIAAGYVVKYMRLDQLKELVKGYFVLAWDDKVRECFFSFFKEVLSARTQDEQNMLFGQVVTQDFFTLAYMTKRDTPIQNMLKSKYLQHILNNAPDPDQTQMLADFLEKVWDNMVPKAFLHEPLCYNALNVAQQTKVFFQLIIHYDCESWIGLPFINNVLLADLTLLNKLSNLNSRNYLPRIIAQGSTKLLRAAQKSNKDVTQHLCEHVYYLIQQTPPPVKKIKKFLKCLIEFSTPEVVYLGIMNSLKNYSSLRDCFAVFVKLFDVNFWQADLHNYWPYRSLNYLKEIIPLFRAAKDNPEKTRCLVGLFIQKYRNQEELYSELHILYQTFAVEPNYNQTCLKIIDEQLIQLSDIVFSD